MTEPTPVRTREFLSALFPQDVPDGCSIELRGRSADGAVVQAWAQSISELVALAKPHVRTCDLWFGPALRVGRGDRDADVVSTYCAWADVDASKFPGGTKAEAFQAVVQFVSPPSVVVDSGGGVQAYWVLEQPATDMDALRAVLRGIQAALSEGLPRRLDPVHNPSRVMRLPNTLNYKYEIPRPTRALLFEPGRRYALEALPSLGPTPSPAEYQDAAFVTTKGLEEIRAKVRNYGMSDWVLDAIDRPDLHVGRFGGDDSLLDYAVMAELGRVLEPGEAEVLWLGSALGQRQKVQSRPDYRRRTIWKAKHDEHVIQPDSARRTLSPLYRFSEAAGLEFTGGRTARRVANFSPEVVRITRVVRDPEPPGYVLGLRLVTVGGDTFEVDVASAALKSERAFQEALAPLPEAFHVAPGMWKHLYAAVDEAREGCTVITAVAHMGWAIVEDRETYFLPGMHGAVTKDGLDPAMLLEPHAVAELPERMRLYGAGVRPPHPNEQYAVGDAFLRLLRVVPPAVIVPLVVQVLGGPLSSLGARKSPPLLHLFGRTGAFKTTLATLALSLFGRFETGTPPETWSSTQNALSRRLYEAKDITLLVDDYKSAGAKEEPLRLVQNYADGTVRARMRTDQENRIALVPRGLLLSTGEDVWEEHQSMAARTLSVSVSLPPAEEQEATLSRISAAQQRAQNGLAGQIGGAYIQWIARMGHESVRSMYVTYKERLETEVRAGGRTVHPRTVQTLASLLAIGSVVEQFVRSEFPAFAAEVSDTLAEGWESLVGSARQQAVEAEQRAPLEWFLAELQDAYRRGAVHFTARSTREDRVLGNLFSGRSIGFFDDSSLYVTRQGTYGWVCEEMRRRGVPVLHSWEAVCQAVRDKFGSLPDGAPRTSYILSRGAHEQVRAAVLPRAVLLEEAEALI